MTIEQSERFNELLKKGARLLFFCLTAFAIWLAYNISANIQLDTDLADVSPQLSDKTLSKQAIFKLQEFAQKRIFLLLSTEQQANEDQLLDAADELRDRLEGIEQIDLLPDNETMFEELVDGLLPYRFVIQSDEQTVKLANISAKEIANNAADQLYKSSGPSSAFGFDRDPLLWHHQSLMTVLKEMRVVSDDDSSSQNTKTLVSLKIREGALNVESQERLLSSLDENITAVADEFSIAIHRSGIFFFAADAAFNAKLDMTRISIGSSIGIVLLLLLAFRSIKALLLPAMSVVIGITFAFIATHSWYGNVHVLTIVFGASLIGVVIDYSLHYFYHQAKETKSSSTARLYSALLLSLLTSLIGYASLSFSNLEALHKVAVFSCCGLIMAWLFVLAFGHKFSGSISISGSDLFTRTIMKAQALFLRVNLRHSVSLALSIVAVATFIAIAYNPFSDDPRVFFKPAKRLLESEKIVSAVSNDFEPGRYIIVSGDSEEQVYSRYRSLKNAISASKEFDQSDLSSLLDWLPSKIEQRENYISQGKLYSENGAVGEFAKVIDGATTTANLLKDEYLMARGRSLDAATVADIFGDSLPPFWLEQHSQNNKPSSIINFVLIRKGGQPDGLQQITQSLKGVEYINTIELTQTALEKQRISALTMLLFAFALIGALLLIRYRSFNSLWMILVPACSCSCVVIICFAFGVPLNLFHVMALFLVLGFGMDYTVFTQELRDNPETTLPAIFLSALTSMLSFGLLSISDIPIIQSFGLALLIGNSANLISTVLATKLANMETKPLSPF